MFHIPSFTKILLVVGLREKAIHSSVKNVKSKGIKSAVIIQTWVKTGRMRTGKTNEVTGSSSPIVIVAI